MNWLASPFGTVEDRLIYYGIQGVDYTPDDKGNPVPTTQGTSDANYVPWRYFAQRPWVWYDAGLPNFAGVLQADEQAIVPNGVEDPTVGLYSPTNSSKGIQLTQPFTEGLTDVIVGRQPLAYLDELVKTWASNGGDKIREEYTQALAASG